MTTITREEYAVQRKEAERRAIIIGEQQRRGQYKPASTKPKSSPQPSLLDSFIKGFKSAFRAK